MKGQKFTFTDGVILLACIAIIAAIMATIAGCGADTPRPTPQEIVAYAAANCPWAQACVFADPCPTLAICPDIGPVFIGERPLQGR